ncbi:uncharacterized protein [Panulirus ornatus]|uniref:uncharacterized protein n=1 Tax=Panulirus ornatus TaxID=150431 RepID=UPI003A845159
MEATVLVMTVLGVVVTQGHNLDDSERSTSEVASIVLQQIQSHLAAASSSLVDGRMYGACTDSFSVFGFLAFLLALLDLILELQDMDDGTRRRRAAQGESVPIPPCQEEQEVLQATSASYSLLRGFLNALATDDAECAKRFLCEGAEEASAAGPLGEVIANVASLNAGSWLLKVNSTLFADVGTAGQSGAKLRGCAVRYSRCFALPDTYRYPGVYRGPQLPSHVYQPIIDEVLDVVRDTLL